jgi:hypothetical protein
MGTSEGHLRARSLKTLSTLGRKDGREAQPNDQRNEGANLHEGRQANDPGRHAGWGQNEFDRRYLTYSSYSAPPLSKSWPSKSGAAFGRKSWPTLENSGGPASKNLGPP